jgi:hypothetical protein
MKKRSFREMQAVTLAITCVFTVYFGGIAAVVAWVVIHAEDSVLR